MQTGQASTRFSWTQPGEQRSGSRQPAPTWVQWAAPALSAQRPPGQSASTVHVQPCEKQLRWHSPGAAVTFPRTPGQSVSGTSQ